MDVKEASEAVIELMKLEKALEPTCDTCENCKMLKLVKDEIINLSSFIVYEQARRILALTRKLAGHPDDPQLEKAFDRLEELVQKKSGLDSEKKEVSSDTLVPPNKKGNTGLN